jgi:hypothetical protein
MSRRCTRESVIYLNLGHVIGRRLTLSISGGAQRRPLHSVVGPRRTCHL